MKPSRAQRKQAKATQPEPAPIRQTVEICRSFGYKLNAGNYESRDFFCSYKTEAPKEQEHEVSQSAYEFCEEEVLAAVKAYRLKMAAQQQRTA